MIHMAYGYDIGKHSESSTLLAMTTYTASAPSPERTTSSITLGWGLVSIPCSVYTGVEPNRVARKEFVRDSNPLAPVGRAITNKETGDVIERDSVVRMAESTTGTWVELDDDEMAACTTDKGQAVIVSFVPNTKVGQYVTEGLNQVRPRRVKGKTDPAGEKALTLLYGAMKARKCTALIKVAMRGPARYALLDSDGNMRLVITSDAIRQAREMPQAVIAKKETELALALIESIGLAAPDLVDDTAVAIQSYVDDKAKGLAPSTVAAPAAAPIDIMADLLASIEADKGSKKKAS